MRAPKELLFQVVPSNLNPGTRSTFSGGHVNFDPQKCAFRPPSFLYVLDKDFHKSGNLCSKKRNELNQFFLSKKTDRKANLFRSFGPFWPHNFEPIFGSVLEGQNEGPGGGRGRVAAERTAYGREFTLTCCGDGLTTQLSVCFRSRWEHVAATS